MDDRTMSEIRWSTTLQMIAANVRSGASIRYLAVGTGDDNKAGYYVVWYERGFTNEENSQYLGSHLPAVQYNLDQWCKERKGVIERGKYR